MNSVDFDPGRLTGEDAQWWEKWSRRAEQALTELKRRRRLGEAIEFNDQIYGDLKRWMYEKVFGKRCAYCQGKAGGQAFIRGEHWRPKLQVTQDDDGTARPVVRDGVEHPGYWWLAYEWTNLLPSCERCNNVKATRFPVAVEHVFGPGDDETVEVLDGRERPLLLHPLRGEDPANHLEFDQFGGIIASHESPLGAETIRVLDLGRGDLVEERLETLNAAMTLVDKAAVEVCVTGCTLEGALGDSLESTPFLAAVIACVARRRHELKERL
jgi:hypothetical protein